MFEEKDPTTLLTDLQSCIDGVFHGLKFPENTSDIHKWELVRIMFEQDCLNNRTKMIQDFKKTNIKDINKRG